MAQKNTGEVLISRFGAADVEIDSEGDNELIRGGCDGGRILIAGCEGSLQARNRPESKPEMFPAGNREHRAVVI